MISTKNNKYSTFEKNQGGGGGISLASRVTALSPMLAFPAVRNVKRQASRDAAPEKVLVKQESRWVSSLPHVVVVAPDEQSSRRVFSILSLCLFFSPRSPSLYIYYRRTHMRKQCTGVHACTLAKEATRGAAQRRRWPSGASRGETRAFRLDASHCALVDICLAPQPPGARLPAVPRAPGALRLFICLGVKDSGSGTTKRRKLTTATPTVSLLSLSLSLSRSPQFAAPSPSPSLFAP